MMILRGTLGLLCFVRLASTLPLLPALKDPGLCGDADPITVGLVGKGCKNFEGTKLRHLQLAEMAIVGSLMDNVKFFDRYFHDRVNGLRHPEAGHTMVGHQRLRNVREALVYVIGNDIPGDFMEIGVWRGGVCIYARLLLNLAGQRHRRVQMFDVFGTLNMYGKGAHILKVTLEDVQHSVENYGLLEPRKSNGQKLTHAEAGLEYYKGLVSNTSVIYRRAFENDPTRKIAVLRCDANSYQSHEDVLYNLWNFIPIGGVIIFDDATHRYVKEFWRDFQIDQGFRSPIQRVDNNGGWIIKRGPALLDQSKRRNKGDEEKGEVLPNSFLKGQPVGPEFRVGALRKQRQRGRFLR
eukprot:Hpha_TRINITY_DN15371_c1_g5::TRINITY_DN15371_c1_g5_i6::g.92333::m.92333